MTFQLLPKNTLCPQETHFTLTPQRHPRKRVALKRTVVELRTLLPHTRLVICTRRLVLQCRLKLESLLEHEFFLPSWNSRIFEKVCVLFETVA
jgi:hypothetical protein